jgi:hypothetical protein
MVKIKYRTELPKLLELYDLTGHAVEIGVAEGRNSQMLISSPAITKLYMIDTWAQLNQDGDGSYDQEWHDNNWKEAHERVEPWKEKAVFLRGLSKDMIKKIPDDSLVLAYIDADHSFEGCVMDLLNIYHKVKTGGIISGHDFANLHYEVNKAVKIFMISKGYSLDDIHTTDEDGDESMVSFWFIKK